MMDTTSLAAGWAVVILGAALQAATGLGGGLVMVPLLALVDPMLVPGPLILSALSLNSLMVYRGRHEVAFGSLWPIIIGMVVGAGAAWPLLSYMEGPETQLIFGLMVLAAVGISVCGWSPRVTGRSMVIAGVVSAFMGTTAAIGGPILALLYQRCSGPEMRATLAGLFFVGSLIILVILGERGRLGLPEFAAALLLIPGWLAGYWLAGPIARRLDAGHTRAVVLIIAGGSSLWLVARGVRAILDGMG
ncbi:sulfite exporter TauE/SafE family protein [Magnetospira sp. QH-2]|uniref:sulfite exporter TauE/SafE family protein n=1 Tax=Magnetospira sp. (strain QH-2) TaxID=1288970 RepID=UPI0005FA73F1|nr:sulfite exporter TauE/SafE family protein [Magnetospira sp. QH-2]